MATKEDDVPCTFDKLFSLNVLHILEMIFFSLDYEAYKSCLEVNKVWHDLLISEPFQRRGKLLFHDEILKDEKKLHSASREGNVHEVRKLLFTGMLNVNCLEKGDEEYYILGVGWYCVSTPLHKAVRDTLKL